MDLKCIQSKINGIKTPQILSYLAYNFGILCKIVRLLYVYLEVLYLRNVSFHLRCDIKVTRITTLISSEALRNYEKYMKTES